MLQPRNGSSWVRMLSPYTRDSQSQCSVHNAPMMPLSGRLRQSNTVGYSMHGCLSGVEHETHEKHQKKRSPFSESLGNKTEYWTKCYAEGSIMFFSVFLCIDITPHVRQRVSFVFMCFSPNSSPLLETRKKTRKKKQVKAVFG